MVKYKDINVAIDITTKKTLVQSLDAVIYSHDSNTVRVIAKISKNGAPLDTDNVSLLLSSCNYSGYVKDGVSIKLDGTIVDDTATFDLPNDILSYQGFLRLDFYVVWSDGSNDGGQPILFEIKKSTIDAQANTWAVTYISDFEQMKQQVSQAAQDAIDTINTDETIAEFEADKQAVKQAKDTAIVEIKVRSSELDASIEQARQIITNRPTELDEPIVQANQAIDDKVADVTSASNNAKQTIADVVSNVQTVASAETVKIQQKSSEVSEDIDTVKSNAIATINSQTDLSTEVSAAKSAIAKSASDTQVVADNAATAINKVVTDTQTLWQSESAKITAVLPQLQTQIQATADNAATIKQQLQDATFPAKLTTAYMQGLNGEGLSIYPYNPNIALGTDATQKKGVFANASVTNGDYAEFTITSKDNYARISLFDGFSMKPKDYEPGSKVTVSFELMYTNWNVPSNATIQEFNMFQRWTIEANYASIWNVYIPRVDGTNVTLNQWIKVSGTYTVPARSSNLESYQEIIQLKSNTAQSTITFRIKADTFKVELGGIQTPWTPAPSEDPLGAIPKYKGYGTLQSTNQADYQWGLNPEYLLTKQQVSDDKLKQAIIALGGTV